MSVRIMVAHTEQKEPIMAYVPPSNKTPKALRKAAWEREQEVKAAARASAQARVAKATKPVSLTKNTPTTYVKG